jgi:hypothetical protein
MIRNEFGKVKRYNNYITKSEKMIKHYTEMKEKYEIKLEGEKETFGKILNLLNPKVNLKKPSPLNPNWRGKVWFGVGQHKKRGWRLFHIISEKKERNVD